MPGRSRSHRLTSKRRSGGADLAVDVEQALGVLDAARALVGRKPPRLQLRQRVALRVEDLLCRRRLDGVERIVGYQRLGGAADRMVVVFALSVDSVLAEVPALAATPAGKNRAIHAIDGHALQGGLSLNSLQQANQIAQWIKQGS